MSVDIITAIKQQAATLTVQEKLQLANYLLEQVSLDQQHRSNRSKHIVKSMVDSTSPWMVRNW